MEKRQLLISKKIPFLKAAVLLKTSLSLFELGDEISLKFSFIFFFFFKAPVNNWSFEYWGPYIDCTGVSAYYAAQLAKLDLKATTVSFRDEETGEWITLENSKEELE